MNLREAARDKPCVMCGANDGTTVLHHIRVGGNAGVGMKPPDFPWGIRVCASCHGYVHGEGRGDHRAMLTAMGRQIEQYAVEGVVKL